MSLPEPPQRGNFASRQAYRSAKREHDKRIERGVSSAGRPPIERLVALEKRVTGMHAAMVGALKAISDDYARVMKILEANGLTDSPLIVRARPWTTVPRNPDA